METSRADGVKAPQHRGTPRSHAVPHKFGRPAGPVVVAHLERASINTPIQGGAADVMTLAMLKLRRSQTLKDLGYRLLLQIHDEVILEGPAESAEAAKAEVCVCVCAVF